MEKCARAYRENAIYKIADENLVDTQFRFISATQTGRIIHHNEGIPYGVQLKEGVEKGQLCLVKRYGKTHIEAGEDLKFGDVVAPDSIGRAVNSIPGQRPSGLIVKPAKAGFLAVLKITFCKVLA